MTIRILRGKVLETKSIYKAEILSLASLTEKEPIEARPSSEDEDYYLLSKPFQGIITQIKRDFVSVVQ